MFFTGNSENQIDLKQRLAIAAKFRARLPEGGKGTKWFCTPYTKGTLRIYPQATFEQLCEPLGTTLAPDPIEEKLLQTLVAGAEEMDMDSTFRVVLPKTQMTLAGIGRDVVVAGMGRWLEVWNKDDWIRESQARLGDLPALIERFNQHRRTP